MRRLLVTLLPLLFIAFLIAPLRAAENESKRTLTIGRITDNAHKHYNVTKAMADYLASRMKNQGITEGRVIITNSVDEMVEHMKEGRVDLISETALVAGRLMQNAGAEALLKANRKRASSYRTVFFAHKDSAIQSLADLRGRVIVFQSATSTAGYMIPAAVLLDKGLPLVRLSSPRQAVPADNVGYVFSSEEVNSALMVHKGVAQAGAFSNADFDSEGSMPAEVAKDMKIFYETVDFPRSLMLVQRKRGTAFKEQLKQVLLSTPSDARAASLLVGYHAITSFEPVNKSDLKGIELGKRLDTIVRTKLK